MLAPWGLDSQLMHSPWQLQGSGAMKWEEKRATSFMLSTNERI